MRKYQISLVFTLSIVLMSTCVFAQSRGGEQAKSGAKQGALLGAVAGAVFGSGDLLGDVVEGAAVGAGVGAFAGFLEGNAMDRHQQKEFEALVRAFGEDNIRGYVELLKCNHPKAIALFKVEQASGNKDHSLTGIWLEGIAEKDRRNKERTDEMLSLIVEKDGDIDDLQMAGIAVDKYVLDLRNDRRFNKLGACN